MRCCPLSTLLHPPHTPLTADRAAADLTTPELALLLAMTSLEAQQITPCNFELAHAEYRKFLRDFPAATGAVTFSPALCRTAFEGLVAKGLVAVAARAAGKSVAAAGLDLWHKQAALAMSVPDLRDALRRCEASCPTVLWQWGTKWVQ